MPSPHRCLRAADVESFVRRRCFAPASGRVGVELERIPLRAGDPSLPVDHHRLSRAVDALGVLPGGSRVSFEPGGQLEVSSPPHVGPAAACAATLADLAVIDPVVGRLGVELLATGLHPRAGVRPVVEHPRYRAMGAYFDREGDAGRRMMCETASLQVNLDSGDGASRARRWRLAHRIGPVLLAAFANSPLTAGRPNGLRSGRAAVWAGIDPTRTVPAGDGRDGGEDPASSWTSYALAARVMLVRVSEARMEPVLAPLPFGRWVAEGHELGFPTLDDLEYHLSTLFPPVRARGWLELRMIDSLPDPWWRVAVAVAAALLDDGEAFEIAERATQACGNAWDEAARYGLAPPTLAGAARACFVAALDALPRLGADRHLIEAVACYGERFVARSRCPADDVLDHLRAARSPSLLTTSGDA